MRAVPKPPKSAEEAKRPKLTEFEYEEMGEAIAEALEFGTTVKLTLFYDHKFESVTGVIQSADSQTGQLVLAIDALNYVKINIMSIVKVD